MFIVVPGSLDRGWNIRVPTGRIHDRVVSAYQRQPGSDENRKEKDDLFHDGTFFSVRISHSMYEWMVSPILVMSDSTCLIHWRDAAAGSTARTRSVHLSLTGRTSTTQPCSRPGHSWAMAMASASSVTRR